MRGLSQRNLVYLRTFAAAFPGGVAQQPVARLPWGHVTVLLDKLTDPGERGWYAAAAVEHGWSRAVLSNQIMGRLHARAGSAPSNFTAQLPAADSELAQQLTRDPYVLDFLDVTAPVAERNLESALVGRLQAFLLELGHGFAFIGRQYRFEVDGEDFRIDLLFFNWVQSRFVVIELKAARFRPEFTGQLGFYVAWVDENLRDPARHAPTVGTCCARDAPTTSSGTPWPVRPRRWRWRTTPTTRSQRPSEPGSLPTASCSPPSPRTCRGTRRRRRRPAGARPVTGAPAAGAARTRTHRRPRPRPTE